MGPMLSAPPLPRLPPSTPPPPGRRRSVSPGGMGTGSQEHRPTQALGTAGPQRPRTGWLGLGSGLAHLGPSRGLFQSCRGGGALDSSRGLGCRLPWRAVLYLNMFLSRMCEFCRMPAHRPPLSGQGFPLRGGGKGLVFLTPGNPQAQVWVRPGQLPLPTPAPAAPRRCPEGAGVAPKHLPWDVQPLRTTTHTHTDTDTHTHRHRHTDTDTQTHTHTHRHTHTRAHTHTRRQQDRA